MTSSLFKTFLRIGAFTLGGGYAMLPLIENEVVQNKKWLNHDLFSDLVAVAQTSPGVFAVNISIFVGNKVAGTKGAIAATLGTVLPSLICILLIAMFFRQIQDVSWVAAAFAGIRPAVVALIAVPTWNMARKENISFFNCWIPIVSALLIWALGVNPIYILLVAAAGGYVYGLVRE